MFNYETQSSGDEELKSYSWIENITGYVVNGVYLYCALLPFLNVYGHIPIHTKNSCFENICVSS